MKRKLKDIATIERSKKGKTYPKGSVLIQVSASKGETVLLSTDGEVDAKYAVIQSNIDVEPIFFHQAIEKNIDEFCAKYQTGLNIQVDTLKNIEVDILHIKTQRIIAKFIELFTKLCDLIERQIQIDQELKKSLLDGMFV